MAGGGLTIGVAHESREETISSCSTADIEDSATAEKKEQNNLCNYNLSGRHIAQQTKYGTEFEDYLHLNCIQHLQQPHLHLKSLLLVFYAFFPLHPEVPAAAS